jgi:hypothetical protein
MTLCPVGWHAARVRSTTEPPVGALDTLVITPRPLADYRNMFLLTDSELTAGPILDCPAGASPFGAQVRARGGAVVSVDPAYATPKPELAERIAGDLARLRPWVDTNLNLADWSYLGSPDALFRNWELAVDFFLTDYQPDGERYVAAALPALPFADDHFRLSLSSHLLFTYPDFLDYETHLASLLELVRVTAGEVRVFPLVDTASVAYRRLEELRADLLGHGVRTELRAASCAYTLGGTATLVLEA